MFFKSCARDWAKSNIWVGNHRLLCFRHCTVLWTASWTGKGEAIHLNYRYFFMFFSQFREPRLDPCSLCANPPKFSPPLPFHFSSLSSHQVRADIVASLIHRDFGRKFQPFIPLMSWQCGTTLKWICHGKSWHHYASTGRLCRVSMCFRVIPLCFCFQCRSTFVKE